MSWWKATDTCLVSLIIYLSCYYSQTKRALAEQLHISRELTKKIVESDEEEQETPDEKDTQEDIAETPIGGLVASSDNPWSLDTKGKSSLLTTTSAADHG